MADVLTNIYEARKKSVAEAKEKVSLGELESAAKRPSSGRFLASLTSDDNISIIAEMKHQSPSAGKIREPYNVEEIAKAYEQGGAAALSVLTEPDFFLGDIDHIRRVRAVTSLPILRKDFIFDPYQIAEAGAAGADAVLIIADMLSPLQVKELASYAIQLRLEPLVEVFESDNLPSAINSGAQLIGVNSRNLRTLEMVPNNVLHVSRLIPHDRQVVAESGLKTAHDMELLCPLRISAALVGESLLKQDDLVKAVKILMEAGQRFRSV